MYTMSGTPLLLARATPSAMLPPNQSILEQLCAATIISLLADATVLDGVLELRGPRAGVL